MRIGLISDTHVPASTYEVPYEVVHAFEGVDMILHAGDIYAPWVLDWLEKIAPVYAVPGDGVDHAMHDDPRMADRHILELQGLKVGMVHMLSLPGMPYEVWPGSIGRHVQQHNMSVRDSVSKLFNQPVDVVVFGDTHYETLERHEGILFVNPGSPTLPRQLMELGTVGILEIESGEASARIIALSEFSEPGRPGPRYI